MKTASQIPKIARNMAKENNSTVTCNDVTVVTGKKKEIKIISL